MKLYVTILILAIVLIAGCTQQISNVGAQAGIGTISIGDIVKNSENYYQKTVTVQGMFTEALAGAQFLQDEQGYNLLIEGCSEPQRTLMLGSTYKATGIINRYEKCICQNRRVGNITEEEWEEFASNISKPIDYKKNVTAWVGACLFLPAPEEGWVDYMTGFEIYKKDVSDCSKISVTSTNCTFQIQYNSTHYIFFDLPLIVEGRCKPNSIEKTYYLECTEPLVKLS
jgi:hypothetical protein